MIPQSALLERLLKLIRRLHTETEDYLDHPEQEQLWYNRGYADGVAEALAELGYAEAVAAVGAVRARDPVAGQEALSWGKAYRHGWDMGSRETRDVIGPRQQA